MYSAMADLAAELGDASLKRACETLWADVMASKIYITSGLGPAAANEGFTEAYDLPNATAYAETCASVALIFWAQRMLHLDLDGRYADMLELALFNNALCGLSRDGEHYFYSNPLDSDGRHAALGLAHLPLLHHERLAPHRLGRRLLRLRRRRRDRAPPLRRHRHHRPPRRRQGHRSRETSTYPWSGAIRIDRHPRGARPPSPSSSASPAGPAAPPPRSTATPSTSPPAPDAGYLTIVPHLAPRRRSRPRPPHAPRAHLRPPGGRGRRRPRGASAGAARLLRGGGRQLRRSRCSGSACPATAGSRLSDAPISSAGS